MANFGPLTAEIGLPVWGTPANFNRFRVLASLLQPQPNFAAWYKEWNYGTFAESATYIRLGGHDVGPHILVKICFIQIIYFCKGTA